MKVGSLVECIRTIPDFFYDGKKLIMPKVGKVYTVVEIGRFDNGSCKGKICIYVDEIETQSIKWNGSIEEIAFSISWFRELLPPIANIEEHINENTLDPVLI